MYDEQKKLVKRILEKDTQAFEEFIQMYRYQIYAIAYKLTGNKEDSLDITQEAFIKLYYSLKKWNGKADLSSWIHRVVVNHSIDMLRKESRRKMLYAKQEQKKSTSVPRYVEKDNIPSKELYLKELRSQLNRAVDKLSKMQKQIFILKYYNDLTIREIGEIFNCSHNKKTH
jgi:RNA polymerase sigma-70 factor (ECF subfamily)